MKHKIKGVDDHLINTKTRAIINDNDLAYQQAKIRRSQIIDKNNEMETLKNTVSNLDCEMSEIKLMLTQILQQLK